MQKQVLAIHDISCVGRCSLTVALPVISAAGIMTSVLPTAVLSTHTGGFTGYTYRDLTADMLPIADHWQTLADNLPPFNAIYTGYLGSYEQLDIVAELAKRFKTDDTLLIVDPVMADNGKLYAGFSEDFPQAMAKLCQQADVITPNITEALFMLEKPYNPGPYTEDYIKQLSKELAEMCKSDKSDKNDKSDKKTTKVVLTGVYFDENGDYGASAYNSADGKGAFMLGERVPGYYHGTGDLFASVLTAALVQGCQLGESAKIATEFTLESIQRTYNAQTDIKYGVNFEDGLKNLAAIIKANKPA
ncbi:MAG: pyridoxamine kinase [Defluviitaleaceae bacterium]|nr:pyridoxamine kinase [Defluviitaleaceae bacterium]